MFVMVFNKEILTVFTYFMWQFDCTFSHFGFILRTNRQTDTHRHNHRRC